jgi:hypothetical protein
LSRDASLAGWLHRSTCHLSRHLCRSEARRRAREAAAVTMNPPDNSTDAAWEDVQGVLDESLGALPRDDREAVLLRYFRGLSLREVGGALSTSEDAARMKINRALEKLRGALARRGITSTTAALSAVLGANAAMAAPAELTLRLGGRALHAASLASAATLTPLALVSMKAKVVFVVAGAALTTAIGVPVVRHREESLRRDVARLEEQLAKLEAVSPNLPASADSARRHMAAALPLPAGSATRTVAASKQSPAVPDALKTKGAMAKALAGMLKMPGMQQLLESQTRPVLESMYADLLDSHWQLTPEQRAQVMDVLLKTMMAAQLDGIGMMQEGMNAENSRALGEKMRAATAQRDAKLKEILGDPAKFAEFLRFEDSVPERHKLNQFKELLATKDAALAISAEQEETLMNMMHRERKALNLGIPFEQETKFDPARYTPESLAAQRERSAQLEEKILAESRAVLRPEQHSLFAESLKNVRAMEELSFNMAQTLFSTPSE